MDLFSLAVMVPCFLFVHMIIISNFVNLWLIEGGFAWRNHRSGSPKGPKFSWPLLGFLPEMGHLAHRKLASTARSLGATRLMAISLGSTRVVISSHPETAKEILCGSAFVDRPVRESARLLMFDRAIGFAPSGDYWRHLRRIASTHMFSSKRVAAMEGQRQEIANGMIERVDEGMREGGFVELRGVLQKGSLENVVESVFGMSERGEELAEMVKEGYDLIGEFNWGDYFPLGFLDFCGVKRRCYRLGVRVRDVVGQIVRVRRESGDFGVRNDFLSVMLSLPEEDQLSDADMVAVLWEMVFRGIDNIAILLEWAMARLVLHQDVQARARREIHTNIGPDNPIRDSDIRNLPYLQATVKEVLRLHPPGPLMSWARLSTLDVHVDKCLIPAGTTAMVNMWAITHDPEVWPDPWAFKPERFLGSEFSVAGSDLSLAPFGSGRRACPGRALALAAVHLWLARFLQRFEWVPSRPVDLGECLKLSLEMKKPLQCFAVGISMEK